MKTLNCSIRRNIRLVTACLLVHAMIGLAQAQNNLGARPATGLLPLSQAERDWMEKNLVKVKSVRMNQLAVQRLNAYRRSQGLPPLNLPTVPFGEEFVPEGAIGLASPNPDFGGALTPAQDNSTLPSFPPVRDQGNLSSCAAFSSTYYVATHMVGLARGWNNRNEDDSTKFSPKWTYPMVNSGQDQGSHLSENIQVLLKHGAATWSDLPYLGDKKSKPANYLEWSRDPAVWRKALHYRMAESGIIKDVHTAAGLNKLKATLANGYAVLFASDVFGWQYVTIKDDPSTHEDNAFVGRKICSIVKTNESGHAITVVGYNDHLWVDLNKNGVVDTGEKGALRICNSWGLEGWSDAGDEGGFGWFAYDALKGVSAVAGADNEDRVPRAWLDEDDRSWRTPFWGNQVYYFKARPAYTPKLLAQFTLTHWSRQQLRIALGASSIGNTKPTKSWEAGALQEQGGDFGFDGRQNAVDGTFVFDFSDLAVDGPQRYYLSVTDAEQRLETKISDFRLTDAAGQTLAVATAGVPTMVDDSTALIFVDYTLSPLKITSAVSTNGIVGAPLSFTVTATGNPTSFGANGLPKGLSINAASGLISGTPTEAGTFVASLSVSGSSGTGSGTLTFAIARPRVTPPSITSSTTANATVGQAFRYTIVASESPTSFDATGLPSGLQVNPATGVISGTPTQAGTFVAQMSASNAGGSGMRALTVIISPPPLPAPVITSPVSASVQAGSPFTYRIIASNNPVSFGADGLPTELAINPATGVISGTPSLARQYTVTLSAQNAAGTGFSRLTLTVLGDSSFGPSNDGFNNRSVLLGSNVSVDGGNNNATAESNEPGHAGSPARKSVWWTWTASLAGTATVNTVGSNFDTLLAVYTGTAVKTLTAVASDDQSGGNGTSQVSFNVGPGTTYQIAVDGKNGAVGNIVLSLQFAGATTAPVNDNFENRIALAGSTATATGASVAATAQNGEPRHYGYTPTKSIWWTWAAPSAGRVTITTDGSDFDTVLAVYTGSTLSSLTEIASDDQGGPKNTSKVAFNVVAGTSYQIAVGGFIDTAGNIALSLNLGATVTFPSNDNFAQSILLSGRTASVTGSNENATTEASEPDHAGLFPEFSVWWRWTAPETGIVTIDTAGSDFDTLLAVYSGRSLSALAEVASSDDDASLFTSRVTFAATGGTSYYIAVDGFESLAKKGTGRISLHLDLKSGGASNDQFANRSTLTGTGPSADGSNVNATAEPNEPDHDDYPAEKSVWWTWTAPASGRMELATSGSSFDTILAVYTGSSLPQLVPVTSNDEDGEAFTSRVSFMANAGTTYQIAVDGFDGGTGTIRLTGRLVELGDTLYATDFDTFTVGEGTLTGYDGWRGENDGEGVQGIIGSIDGPGNTAYLGFSTPTNRYVGVFRPLNFDPVGQGRPVVSFSMDLTIVDSSNDRYDTFGVSMYNRSGDFLAAILFDNDELKVGYANGGNSRLDTGVEFDTDFPLLLNGTIDFSANTWSASMDGFPLFDNKPFHVGGRTLDLGDLTFEWYVRDQDPTKAGDNFLLLDNYSVSASSGFKPPAIVLQPESQTAALADIAFFWVSATGTLPLSYQWSLEGRQLAGETNSFLFLFDLEPSQAGSYTVTVRNQVGSITSSPAILTVGQPQGSPIRLTITLTPSPRIEWTSQAGLSYRVQFTPDLSIPNWTFLSQAIPGTGGSLSFTDTALSATDRQRYYRVVEAR